MALGGKRPGAGRKKGFAALEAEQMRIRVAQRLSEELEPILDMAIVQAKQGDKFAREWLTDRAYGRAVQPIKLDKVIFDDEHKKKAKAAIEGIIGATTGKRG